MRKKLPTILIAIFLCIFILQMVSIIFLLLTPIESQAVNFEPQIEIPGSKFNDDASLPVGEIDSNTNQIKSILIGEYIEAIYNYAIGIVGILATVVMMLGGIIWITAGGNQTRIGEAKAWIGASLTGLVLVLTSYTILNMINPDLLNFEPIRVNIPKEYDPFSGCCNVSGTESRDPITVNNTDGSSRQVCPDGYDSSCGGCCGWRYGGTPASRYDKCGEVKSIGECEQSSNFHLRAQCSSLSQCNNAGSL